MKKYLTSVEEVVKALEEKGKVIKETESGFIDTYEIINGFICSNGNINVQISFQSNRIYTEEPEQLKFEVNRAYKVKCGEKVFIEAILETEKRYRVYSSKGLYFINFDGTHCLGVDSYDIVGYWEEEK